MCTESFTLGSGTPQRPKWTTQQVDRTEVASLVWDLSASVTVEEVKEWRVGCFRQGSLGSPRASAQVIPSDTMPFHPDACRAPHPFMG